MVTLRKRFEKMRTWFRMNVDQLEKMTDIEAQMPSDTTRNWLLTIVSPLVARSAGGDSLLASLRSAPFFCFARGLTTLSGEATRREIVVSPRRKQQDCLRFKDKRSQLGRLHRSSR